MDDTSVFAVVTGLFGGLAIFLLGFERLTASLKSAAGSRLADLLARASATPIRGAASGVAVTALIQSSSVTTVLTVGFAAAGVMSLTQTIGVIAGSALGSTVTVQIVAFDVLALASAMVAVGFLGAQWKARPGVAQAGGALLGLGLVFLGMDLMGTAMSPLRDQPIVTDVLTGGAGPLVALLVGLVLTALVQSSSATMGIVVVLAAQGLVALPTAIAVALGAKIGTCVTAVIAASGGGVAARRVASFHVLFNLGGALLWLPLIGVLADIATAVSPSAPQLSGQARLAAEVPRQLANAFTLFTAVNLVLVLPFTQPIARGLRRLVRDRVADPFASADHLDPAVLSTPAVALELARLEVGRLGAEVVDLVRRGGEAALRGQLPALQRVKADDDAIDDRRRAIVTYLADLNRGELTDEQADDVASLLAIADDLEAVGDVVATNLVRLGRKRLEERLTIAESTLEVLDALHARVTDDLAHAVRAIAAGDRDALTAVLRQAREVTAMRDAALARQADRLVAGGPDKAGRYAREVELIAHLYRVHALTRRVARTELADPVLTDPDPGQGPGQTPGAGSPRPDPT
ncbi:MAG: Na/Pi cotransporter family protein [Nitriliruptoraceae bacterium]|nr:Na/Pi cotransporter family protein [Nitriliruptoraceae bacterium]